MTANPLPMIYSYAYPEVISEIDKFTEKFKSASVVNTWDKKSKADESFLNTFVKSLTGDHCSLHKEWFRHNYTTNGSFEALREAMAEYKTVYGSKARLHVFEGEYEGIIKCARAYEIECIIHSRESYKKSLEHLNHDNYEIFYLTNPSAIDGNVWSRFNEFLEHLAIYYPRLCVYLDIAYAGCLQENFKFNFSLHSIKKIFFSLSKAYGVYHYRLGGVFSKTPMKGFDINRWFTNIYDLELGTHLLKTFGLTSLPKKYIEAQKKACVKLSASYPNIMPSETILIGYSPDKIKGFERADGSRFCLSPILNSIISEGDI